MKDGKDMEKNFHFKGLKQKIIGLVVVFVLITFFVAASWNQIPVRYASQELLVQIGIRLLSEEDDIIEPDVIDIDELVDAIIANDPFLQDGTTRLHVLGQNNGSNSPKCSDLVDYFDTIIWIRENGAVMVALATAAIDMNIFDSWETLEDAFDDPNVALSGWEEVFRLGDNYTRAHAPVFYNSQAWLKRHDEVVSIPSIGDEWFLISDTWALQSYPIGSIVMYQGRHFYKISESDSKPGTDTQIWREIPRYEGALGIVSWYQTDWNADDIVVFEDNFYISLVDNNSQIPGMGSDWVLISRFDPTATVPEFVMGTHYGIGDMVQVIHEDESLYFLKKVEWSSPNPIGDTSGAWSLIQNWHELRNVQTWRPNISYGNDFVGLVFEHNGQFFEKLSGWAALGTPPLHQPTVWRRILTWNESIAPLNHEGPGEYAENHVFRSMVNGDERFFASIQDVPYWFQGSVDTPSEFFRPVEEWNSSQVYTVFGHAIWEDDFSHRYHAYTLDDDGNRTFWVLRGSPTGVTGTVIGVHPQDSPFWERIEFFNRENSVIMHIDGVPIVWDRNPNILLGTYIRQPSDEHNDWIRRETIVNDEVVYTVNEDDVFRLWRKIGDGPSTQEPSIGDDWILEDFRTGIEFVYTVSDTGIVTFWRSPTQSSTVPGSPGWIRYSPPINRENEIVYIDIDDQTFYFATNRTDSLFQLSTSWIGGSNEMQYHWNENNEYQSGDIVVFGTTMVNTYRYFRLRSGIPPSDTRGVSPMSPLGRQMWQPLRLIDWD